MSQYVVCLDNLSRDTSLKGEVHGHLTLNKLYKFIEDEGGGYVIVITDEGSEESCYKDRFTEPMSLLQAKMYEAINIK